MALLAFSAVVLSCFLLACVVLLVLDLRGERRAVRAALQALGRRVQAQDEQIGYLSRAVGLLVPPDARPTTAHRAPLHAGLSRPFQPSPEQVEAARSVRVGAVSVDTTGDRGAFSESPEAMRARIEAEADERSRARVALPPPAVEPEADEPEDEPTTFYSGTGPKRRPTLLGGLAGAALERPTMSATRAAEAFRKAHPSSPTLVSAGVEPPAAKRDTLTPTEPNGPTLDAQIQHRFAEKVAAAQEAGQDVGHCHGERCMDRGEGIALCDCQCEPCARLLALLVQAEQEIRREREQE